MRKDGDKISIRMDADGHYVFYSFRDEHDHGTILDFVMRRQGKNFVEARKVLRTWTGTARIAVFQHLEEAPRARVAARFSAWLVMRWAECPAHDC